MRTYKNRGKGGAIGARASFVCYVTILIFTVGAARADTITVGLGVGYDFNNIQAGINDANDGDEVIVADGTYTGPGNRNIDFIGKDIIVRSENGALNCIIDVNASPQDWHNNGFYLHRGEKKTSVIQGFTITGGYTYKGGGIYCNSSSPTIKNCVITDNVCSFGGGIACEDNSNATISNCTIIGNIGDDAGGGIYCRQSNITVKNCTIIGNIVDDRSGGGIFCYGSDITVTNCTFADNSAPRGDFLACGYTNSIPSYVQISNCVIWDGGDEIQNNDGSEIVIIYSDVRRGYLGKGNIDLDPCFVEPGYWDANGTELEPWDDFWVEGDYHLLEGSPCIDTGDPNYVPAPDETDLDGKSRVISGRIDMGAYEYQPPVEAKMKLTPQTLNCNSKGNWITCHIWLPEEYSVSEIDPDSILLEQRVPAEWTWFNEKQNEAMAKFNRSKLSSILEEGNVELTVSCHLLDGTYFEGKDTIRVIGKGNKNK